MVNYFGKIWVFWKADWNGEVVANSIQQLTIKFKHQVNQKEVMITAVYARCSVIDRLELWEELEQMTN